MGKSAEKSIQHCVRILGHQTNLVNLSILEVLFDFGSVLFQRFGEERLTFGVKKE